MDLPDQSPLDLANHVAAKVKEHARPWRAIIALVVAVVAAYVASQNNQDIHHWASPKHVVPNVVTVAAVVAFCLFGAVAVVGLADKARDVLAIRSGTSHAGVARYAVLLVGGIIMLLTVLALLRLPIGQLVVGGALTTILIGIAAQQSLGNVFAGIVLLFSRPFAVGDAIVLRSGSLGGVNEGTVTGIGLTYVVLDTEDGEFRLPNSQVLAAGVGRRRVPVAGPPAAGDADGSEGQAADAGLAPGQVPPGQAVPGLAAAAGERDVRRPDGRDGGAGGPG